MASQSEIDANVFPGFNAGGPTAPAGLAENIDVTNTSAFLNRPHQVDMSVLETSVEIPIRQEAVYPGTTISVLIPASHGFVSNPVLRFDLEMRFPYTMQNLPNGLNYNNIRQLTAIPSGNTAPYNAYVAQYGCTPWEGVFCGRNVPDYCVDPPTNLGATTFFNRVVLSQNSSGKVIDENNQSTGFEPWCFLQAVTKDKSELWAYDWSMKANIFQNAPGIDMDLIPPIGCSGTRRATSWRLDPVDPTTIIITQSYSMPIPLNLGPEWPIRWMAGGDDLQLLIELSNNAGANLRAVERFYTGTLDTIVDTKSYMIPKASPQLTDNLSLVSDDYAGVQKTAQFTPISYYQFVPWGAQSPYYTMNAGTAVLPTAVAGTQEPPKFMAEGIGCGVRIVLQGVILDTADLEDILGAPQLVGSGANVSYQYFSNATAGSQYSTVYPLSSMLNNGFRLSMKLTGCDPMDTTAVMAAAGYVPSQLLTNEPLNVATAGTLLHDSDISAITGLAVFRDIWVDHMVAASDIQYIGLTQPSGQMVPMANTNGFSGGVGSQTYGASLSNKTNYSSVEYAALTSNRFNSNEKDLGSIGKVFILFSTPQVITVPMFGANYCSFFNPVSGTNGNPLNQCLSLRCPQDSRYATDQWTFNGVEFTAGEYTTPQTMFPWAGSLKFDLRVGTNTPAYEGLNNYNPGVKTGPDLAPKVYMPSQGTPTAPINYILSELTVAGTPVTLQNVTGSNITATGTPFFRYFGATNDLTGKPLPAIPNVVGGTTLGDTSNGSPVSSYTGITGGTYQVYSEGNNPLLSPRALITGTGQERIYKPWSVQCSSYSFKNMRLGFQRPAFPQEAIEAMDDLYESIEGIRITIPRFYQQNFPIETITSREVTFPINATQPYFIMFSPRGSNASQNWPGFPPGQPMTPFSYWSLRQGAVQLYNRTQAMQALDMGSIWPRCVPYIGNGNTTNVANGASLNGPVCNSWQEIKGFGSTQFACSQWQTAIGNAFGANRSTGESQITNISYINRMGYNNDVVYPMNTLGGAATVPRIQPITINFQLATYQESAVLHPVMSCMGTGTNLTAFGGNQVLNSLFFGNQSYMLPLPTKQALFLTSANQKPGYTVSGGWQPNSCDYSLNMPWDDASGLLGVGCNSTFIPYTATAPFAQAIGNGFYIGSGGAAGDAYWGLPVSYAVGPPITVTQPSYIWAIGAVGMAPVSSAAMLGWFYTPLCRLVDATDNTSITLKCNVCARTQYVFSKGGNVFVLY